MYHPISLHNYREFLYENNISGVFILSACQHRSYARRISLNRVYDLYYFMNSVLTNYHTHPLVEIPELIFKYNENSVVGLLYFNTKLDDPKMTFEIVNIDNESI